ncbi:UNVERIFIED_CONTAM: hypothetical protein FKN15_038195 [Acipenser sinensis]
MQTSAVFISSQSLSNTFHTADQRRLHLLTKPLKHLPHCRPAPSSSPHKASQTPSTLQTSAVFISSQSLSNTFHNADQRRLHLLTKPLKHLPHSRPAPSSSPHKASQTPSTLQTSAVFISSQSLSNTFHTAVQHHLHLLTKPLKHLPQCRPAPSSSPHKASQTPSTQQTSAVFISSQSLSNTFHTADQLRLHLLTKPLKHLPHSRPAPSSSPHKASQTPSTQQTSSVFISSQSLSNTFHTADQLRLHLLTKPLKHLPHSRPAPSSSPHKASQTPSTQQTSSVFISSQSLSNTFHTADQLRLHLLTKPLKHLPHSRPAPSSSPHKASQTPSTQQTSSVFISSQSLSNTFHTADQLRQTISVENTGNGT